MKNRILFTIVLLSVIFASCKRCVPEGPFVHLYLKNESTHNVVVEHQGVGAISLIVGQKSSVNYGDYYHAPLPKEGYFSRAYVYSDTATFTFDDGTVWKHYYTTDTTVSPYMESFVPMDRLLCGDVGFGKTEVAFVAAFKAIKENNNIQIKAISYFGDEFCEFNSNKIQDGVVSIKALGRIRQKYANNDTLIILNLKDEFS